MKRPLTSASNIHRRFLCPGSAFMEEDLPDEDSKQAQEGAMLHDYAAHPEKDRSRLSPAHQDLLDLADELTQRVIRHLGNEDPIAVDVEKTLYGDGISGTPDLVYYYEDCWLVIDRKFGYRVVTSADLNLQLRVYAVLTADPAKKEGFVAIVQPRASYDQRITIASYTREDIKAAREQIKAILYVSAKQGSPLIAGEQQCRYCKAKIICPEFRKMMMLPPAIIPDGELSKTAREAHIQQRLAECTDEQLEQVMMACRLAEFAKTPALDEARKRIKAGGLTNYTLGKETKIREITDVRRAIALLSLAGMAKEEIFDCVQSMALGKLAETLRKKHSGWGHRETQEWINHKLESVIELVTRKEMVLRK